MTPHKPSKAKSSKTTTSLSKNTNKSSTSADAQNSSGQTLSQIVAPSQKQSKKKKEILLKHLSGTEKQKIAHLILTIHHLTEQKVFYETKYASLLPKLKQIMEKFEERTKRLAQYQSAMKKMKTEMDEWKDRSVKLRDQVKVVEREREEWRERYEELYLEKQRHEESMRNRTHRSVQMNALDFLETNNASVQAYIPDERIVAKHQQHNKPLSGAHHHYRSPQASQFVEIPRVNTSQHVQEDNLSQISDTESIVSIRQREVDELLRRSEAVLNKSRASRPSTPDELLQTRRRRQELLRKSADLHRVSESHDYQSHNLNQYDARPVYNQTDIIQSNKYAERETQQRRLSKSHHLPPNKEDANDLFHFVDILEQQPDTTMEHRNNGDLLDHSQNPLSESHVSFISAVESEVSHATTTYNMKDVSEAWFEKADTFQENDIFDIIG